MLGLLIGSELKQAKGVRPAAKQGAKMKNQLRPVLVVLAAVALAGCGGNPATTNPTAGTPLSSATAPAPGVSTTPATGVELTTATSAAGPIVVGKDGRSVYVFTKDVKDSGTSACKDTCAASWPAVTTSSDAPSVEGVSATLGTISAADGSKQITLNGLPIYYYAQDTKAGDILGQGVGEAWYLVSPSGDMLTSAGGY